MCWKKMTIALLLAAGLARGEMIYQGTHELGLSGFLDFETADDATVQADVRLGQFVRDYWEVGAGAGMGISDSLQQFRVDLFTEYNFEINASVLPYLGASIGMVAADVDYEDVNGNDVAFTVGGELGLKGFLSENVALYGGVEFLWATDNVFLSGSGVEDTDIRLKLGFRFYY